MTKETGRIRFHYGFYVAMKVEYDIIHADLTYEQEKQLGEDPIRLDFLIIKKDSSVTLHDPIGEFFKAVNLFEYKSPEDSLTIDSFYKAQGYGLIYKGYGRKVNELPVEDMTLTLVRHSYPRDLMKALKSSGFIICETHPGIFRVDGKIPIPVQIVVSSRLPDGEYNGLKLLAGGCTRDDIVHYAERASASEDENIKTNAGTVMEICLDINRNLNEQLKGASIVGNLIREIKQEIKQEYEQETNERVASDMLRDNYPLSAIEKISRLSEDTIRSLAKNLGIAVL